MIMMVGLAMMVTMMTMTVMTMSITRTMFARQWTWS